MTFEKKRKSCRQDEKVRDRATTDFAYTRHDSHKSKQNYEQNSVDIKTDKTKHQETDASALVKKKLHLIS